MSIRPAFADEMDRLFDGLASRSVFIEAIGDAQSKSEFFEAVLAYYGELRPVIERTPPNRWAMDVYEVDWLRCFSPIEQMLWGDIRTEGVVLYPQYPIAGYFVDFGHPVAKVAIECDGAQWHLNKARETRRQAAIEGKGWTVYRLTGSECVRDGGERYDPQTGEWHYEICEAQRLVREIGRHYGLR